MNQRRLLRGGDLDGVVKRFIGVLARRKVETQRHQEEEQVRYVCKLWRWPGYWYIRQSINGVWTDNSLSEWEGVLCGVDSTSGAIELGLLFEEREMT